jgi:predicted dehydrogenase
MPIPLKIVCVGCGHIVEQWLRYATRKPGLEIVGLVDLKIENAEKWRDQFGLVDAQLGTDLSAMLKTLRPNLVFDCTVPSAHTPVVLTALKAGCHVFGEKPMADSLANAHRMIAAAKKANRVYAVMQNRRFTPGIRAFSRFLAGGTIGKLTTLHSSFLIGAHFWTFQNHMRHPLLLDMAIHTFDEARFISGAEPVSVYARDWKPEGCWFAGEASAVCFFEMSNGVIFTYRGSWCAEGFNTAWDADWQALATKGSARWDGLNALSAQSVTTVPSGRPEDGIFSSLMDVPIPAVDCPENGHQAWLDHAFACLAQGQQPETRGEDNIQSLAMVLAAIKSSETKRGVPIRTQRQRHAVH